MSVGYLLLWAADRLKRLEKSGDLDRPLEVIYGSPHQSAPGLAKYGIGAGDQLYVCGLTGGVVRVVARVTVDRVVSAEAYFRDVLRLPQKTAALHIWDLAEELERTRPELGHRLPIGCVNEAAIAREADAFGRGLELPATLLAKVQTQPKKGPLRDLPVVDGKVHSSALQGHFFRLTDASRARIDAHLAKRTR